MKKKIMIIGVGGFFLLGLVLLSSAKEKGHMRGEMHMMRQGKGMHGMMGMCPMMMKGVKISKKNIKKGVQVTFIAEDKETVEKLQAMIDKRLKMREMRKEGDMRPMMNEMMENMDEDCDCGMNMMDENHHNMKMKKMRGMHKMKGERRHEHIAAKYICPMGDYESDKPGKCPKCGMKLIKNKNYDEDDDNGEKE